MNTHGIDERAGDEHLLHTPRKWTKTEEEKAEEERRIAQRQRNAARFVVAVGIKPDSNTGTLADLYDLETTLEDLRALELKPEKAGAA